MTNLLFTDFESYYDSSTFTLKKMSMFEYIKSPRFKVHGVGLAINGEKPEWITGYEVAAAFRTIDWNDTTVVAHNAKFDGGILSWVYGIKPKSYVCTQSMARAVFGHTLPSVSLASVAAQYGLAPKGFMQTDGLLNLTPQDEAELAVYCKHDVELCQMIYNRMLGKFPVGQFPALDWTIKAFVEPSLRLNPQVLEKCYEDEKLRRDNIFTNIGIPKEVFSSNKQFPELLKSRGFDIPMKVSKRTQKEIPALSVGDSAFLEMRNEGSQELKDLCEARMAAKSCLLETRADKFLKLSALGPYPFDVSFSGAKQTHRYSGAGGAGGNPQNLPRNSALREAVEAPEGHKLVVGDFAGIELRLVAWLAMETKLMYAITQNVDIYCDFASKFFGRIITKADKLERQFGKCAILGLGYQMGPKRFIHMVRVQTGMTITDEEAKRAVELYRMHYWHIPRLWDALHDRIKHLATGVPFVMPNAWFVKGIKNEMVLPSGLTLKYPDLQEIYTERRAEWSYKTYQSKAKEPEFVKLYGGKLLENICQALAGEICKLAIDRARAAGLTVAGQVHDEIIVVCKDEEVILHKAKLQLAMEAPVPWWPYLRLKAEVGVGQNWKVAK